MKINPSQKKEINRLFNEMNSKSDFLNLLNYTKSLVYGDKAYPFTEKQLNFYINIDRIQKAKEVETYKTFEIKKKSGKTRTIHSPIAGLKAFQICLNVILSSVYEPHKNAFGFVIGKSIVDNAKNHVAKNYVYNIDLKDFFPSVDAKRVWGRLTAKPFNLGTTQNRKQIANMIKAICCTPMKVERLIDDVWSIEEASVLPQGAATSPILTNAICERLDYKLTKLSKHFGLEYSRYADDITFSSMHNTYKTEKGEQEAIYESDSSFDKKLRRIISSQNFHINEKKVRLQKRGYKQEVTGLIVNENVNTPNYYIKELRQWIYFLESKGYDKAYELFLKKYVKNKGEIRNAKPNMYMVIEGKLLYLKMVKGENNSTYLKLKARFEKLTEVTNELKKINDDVNKTEYFSDSKTNEVSNKKIQKTLDMIFDKGLDEAMKDYTLQYGRS
jgi:hypothetical protein